MMVTVKEAKRVDRKLNCFITITDELKEGKGKLKGLSISVKDCICTKGMQSTAGSEILKGYVPPFDATVVERLKKEGASILGKTNQDEFGFGTFCTNSGYGKVKNPWDTSRSPGGSSGGAAAATAALGTDHVALAESTGGSISCPASFCGVVGLTPTYGLVSRYGLIDYANSLDKIGPIGRSVEDVAKVLSVMAGHDLKDLTSLKEKKKDFTKALGKPVKKMTVGIPNQYFKGVDKGVKKKVRQGIKTLESLGLKTKKVSLPKTKYALAAYYLVATSEASTNLAKFCGMRYGLHAKLKGNFNQYFSKVRTKGFGKEAKRRIMLGTYARMAGYRDAYYLRAFKVRTLVIKDFKKAFKKCDVLAAPTMPVLPPKFSEVKKMSPIKQYQMDVLTVPANLAGIPQVSLPCGFVNDLPVGLHLLGDHLQEEKVLRVASALEKELDIKRRPDL